MSLPGRTPQQFRRRSADGTLLSSAWVVLGILCGLGVLFLGIRNGHAIDVITGIGVIAVCALLSRPSRRAIARARASRRPPPDLDAPVVIYWRANDLRSARLRSRLKDVRDRAVWVSTWHSRDAEDRVRALNGGDEILPTVLIKGVPITDPLAEEVREAIEQHTPAGPDTGSVGR